ncbi:hypothetical protein HDU87_007281 [Geranomyces variabilis]|uniref:CUE domain-containing protein n=1 Tax=Geranomyces variabilis TaxID=109894 RepID=A0AAD5XKG3_9FUNG|nr:hypothetical protein HDU87_007281 [Geranomyces variabilis]
MEEIRAIFPQTDPEVCQAILDANGGNVEAAINAMLEMSNPTTAAATSAPPDAHFTSIHDDEALARALAQQEGDEELARRIEQEDRERAQAARRAQADRSGGAALGGDPSPTFRETKEKVVAATAALGETAKKKFAEAKGFFDKTFNSGRGEGGVGGIGSGGGAGGEGGAHGSGPAPRHQYNNLPDDDFDSLIDDAPDTPLGGGRRGVS